MFKRRLRIKKAKYVAIAKVLAACAEKKLYRFLFIQMKLLIQYLISKSLHGRKREIQGLINKSSIPPAIATAKMHPEIAKTICPIVSLFFIIK